MPITAKKGAEATSRCPDPDCDGHVQRTVPVTLRTVVWTERTGNGPVVVGRQERSVDVDKVCGFCGGELEVSPPTFDGRTFVHELDWPAPTLNVDTPVDETLPAPPPEPTLEERVAALERQMAELEVQGAG